MEQQREYLLMFNCIIYLTFRHARDVAMQTKRRSLNFNKPRELTHQVSVRSEQPPIESRIMILCGRASRPTTQVQAMCNSWLGWNEIERDALSLVFM